jgi:hypothetical protein
MRFLFFEKKTQVKRFEPGASSVRPGLPAPETRQNLPFFSRKFTNVRAFPFRVVIWAVGATTLIFFVQKVGAHLATYPCKNQNCLVLEDANMVGETRRHLS